MNCWKINDITVIEGNNCLVPSQLLKPHFIFLLLQYHKLVKKFIHDHLSGALLDHEREPILFRPPPSHHPQICLLSKIQLPLNLPI